ncbi:multicopper oxidase domain-containing protein [Roseibium sp. MMSF_3544]|uniref:multicopper oxidase domain-containing protein n=1 Tax=unclassified Roseibium TaxID=2629323 RepID=UPI00273EB8EA|nr:multicopper oxidase domain-containing protein [Roseibium sp. MMSF_3544]
MSLTLSRRRFLAGGLSLTGVCLAGPSWSNTARPALPIPPLADGTNGEPVDLTIRTGLWSFKPGVMTPTLGINQDYLGPTIRTRRNTELNLNYHNTLTEGVSVHGHGLHVPGNVDGGPQLEMPPGERWQPTLSIVQPAATCWYHSHTHGKTGTQTYRGLAGMMIIDDDDDAVSKELPNRYGLDDLPVIIQDRTFDAAGRLVYSLKDAGEDGWFGDTVVINGAMSPVADVPAGKVRLRLLNGANARFYILAFADNRTFYKIASDGGLLEAPVPMKLMEMSPGERCEIIVDLSEDTSAELLTFFEDDIDAEEEGILSGLTGLLDGPAQPAAPASLLLKVDRSLVAHTAPVPEQLATIIRPSESEIKQVREFVLEMDHGEGDGSHTGHGGDHAAHAGHGNMNMTINGAVMDMSVINERVERGVWERWRIRSDQGAHPFHVHGCSFLIEQMEGANATADQRGWKDTVVLDDDDWSEIVVRFDYLASEDYPYMYHCHILEHEDQGMMGQFTVTDKTG